MGATRVAEALSRAGHDEEHTVVAVAMHSWGRDELGEGLEELKRREQQLGAAVDVGLGKR